MYKNQRKSPFTVSGILLIAVIIASGCSGKKSVDLVNPFVGTVGLVNNNDTKQ